MSTHSGRCRNKILENEVQYCIFLEDKLFQSGLLTVVDCYFFRKFFRHQEDTCSPITKRYYQLNSVHLQLQIQGCALAEPGGPWRLTFAQLGDQKILLSSYRSYMLGNLDFTVSGLWAPFNFPQSKALNYTINFISNNLDFTTIVVK